MVTRSSAEHMSVEQYLSNKNFDNACHSAAHKAMTPNIIPSYMSRNFEVRAY